MLSECRYYGENWIDAYNFSYDSSLGINNPFEAYFYGPGPDTSTDSPDLILGSSTDSASVTTPPPCGDVRDQMITEYKSRWSLPNGKIWSTTFGQVSCTGFHNTAAMDRGNWRDSLQLVESYRGSRLRITQFRYFAVLPSTGLAQLSNAMGQDFSISSGYRNPHAEIQATVKNCQVPISPKCAPAAGSRHMAGDAADLRTNNNQDFWSRIQATAHNKSSVNPPACVEPQVQATLTHSDLDWRTESSGHFRWAKPCPAQW